MTFLKMPNFISKHAKIASIVLASLTLLSACNNDSSSNNNDSANASALNSPQLVSGYESRLGIYKEVTLSADLNHLSANQKQMLSLLIDASKIMDDLFWQQAFFKN